MDDDGDTDWTEMCRKGFMCPSLITRRNSERPPHHLIHPLNNNQRWMRDIILLHRLSWPVASIQFLPPPSSLCNDNDDDDATFTQHFPFPLVAHSGRPPNWNLPSSWMAGGGDWCDYQMSLESVDCSADDGRGYLFGIKLAFDSHSNGAPIQHRGKPWNIQTANNQDDDDGSQ